VTDLVLACPDFERTFILQTDAIVYIIAAILEEKTEEGKVEWSRVELFDNGEEELGHCLGNTQAKGLSRRPLHQVCNGSPDTEVADQH